MEKQFSSVIQEIMQAEGWGILKSPQRFLGNIADRGGDFPKERGMFMNCCDEKFLKIFYEAKDGDEQVLKTAAQKAAGHLQEKYMMTEEGAFAISGMMTNGVAAFAGLDAIPDLVRTVAAGKDSNSGEPAEETQTQPQEQKTPVFCTQCGKPNDPHERFCIHCGQPMGPAGPSAGASAGASMGGATGAAGTAGTAMTGAAMGGAAGAAGMGAGAYPNGAAAAYPQQKSKKGLIIIICVIVAAAICGAAYFLTHQKTTVDLTENITTADLTFSGTNGSGKASFRESDFKDKLDYDRDDERVAAVIDTVKYSVTPKKNLSNNDTITVEATYSKQTAEKKHVEVTGLSKEIRVGGLEKAPQSSSATQNQTQQSTPSNNNNSGNNASNSSGNSNNSGNTVKTEGLYVSEPDGYANIRTGRGTNYDIVGQLDNGAKVVVTDLKDGWYKIYEGQYAGNYISARTLTGDPADVITEPEIKTEVFYVSEPDGYANVRTGRGTDHDVAGRLDNGTKVVVTDLKNGWYKIYEGEYAGNYISARTLVEQP